MSGFLARQLREMTASVEATGGRLLARMMLVVVLAALVFVFVLACLAFLSVALYVWVAQMAGAMIAALAVAGLDLFIAIICLVLLQLKRRAGTKKVPKQPRPNTAAEASAEKARAELSESIDRTVAPLIAVLHDANMKPEEVAVRLGAALTKEVGPFALVALALAAGFLFGRRLTESKKEGRSDRAAT